MKKYAIILIAIGIMALSSFSASALPINPTSSAPITYKHFVVFSNGVTWFTYEFEKTDNSYFTNIYYETSSTVMYFNQNKSGVNIRCNSWRWDNNTWVNENITNVVNGAQGIATGPDYLNSNLIIKNLVTSEIFFTPPPPPNQTVGEIEISLQGQTSQNFIVNVKDKDSFKLQTTVNFPLWKSDFSAQTHSYNWTWKIEGTDDNNITYQFAEKPKQLDGDGLIDDTIGYMQDYLIFTPYFKIGSLGDKTIKVTCTNEWGYSISDTITIRLVAESTGAVTGTIIPSNTTGNAGNGDTIADKPNRDTYDDGILGDLQYGFDTLIYYITMPFEWLGLAIDNLTSWLSDSMSWVSNISNFFGAFFSFLPKEVTSAIGVLITVIVLFSILRIFRR